MTSIICYSCNIYVIKFTYNSLNLQSCFSLHIINDYYCFRGYCILSCHGMVTSKCIKICITIFMTSLHVNCSAIYVKINIVSRSSTFFPIHTFLCEITSTVLTRASTNLYIVVMENCEKCHAMHFLFKYLI